MIVSSQARSIRCAGRAPGFSSQPFFCAARLKPLHRAAAVSSVALLIGLSSVCHAVTQVGGTLPPAPDKLYGELFVAVQTAQIYPDQKTFVDATPNADPAAIVQLYQQQKNNPGFSLASFVNQYFTPPSEPVITPPANQTLRDRSF